MFVARGVPDKIRRVDFTRVEGKAPDLVVEVTSMSTRDEDLDTKRALYRDVLLVAEDFLFDPECEYLDPSSGFPPRGRQLRAQRAGGGPIAPRGNRPPFRDRRHAHARL